MQKYEQAYRELVKNVLINGELRSTRNAPTRALFATSLKFDLSCFPILQGRKIFYKGVFGELAAMLRKPTHIDDFTRWGCNFWKQWAKEDGSIEVDYGNAWFADGQIDHLKHCLANDRTDRRMLIDGWRPERLPELDLPCCHMLYQFYVTDTGELNMQWYQRSADVMIGIPSNMVFAAAWLIAICNEFNLEPGEVTMIFGDTHIYESHVAGAEEYLSRSAQFNPVEYQVLAKPGKDFCQFVPSDIFLVDYLSDEPINFELFS